MLDLAGDLGGMFADVVACLEELRRDMTKRTDRIEERAQRSHEMLGDEQAYKKSQAKCDQVLLIQNTNLCCAESLAPSNKESEERYRRMTIEMLRNNHDSTYAQTMINLEIL